MKWIKRHRRKRAQRNYLKRRSTFVRRSVEEECLSKKINDAKKMLKEIPDTLKNKPEILALQAQIELTNQAEGIGELNDLRKLLSTDVNNHQVRFDLALALFTKGETSEAIQELLAIFRVDQEWNDDAARQQLFKFFDILGGEDPITLSGRRQLASMLFA